MFAVQALPRLPALGYAAPALSLLQLRAASSQPAAGRSQEAPGSAAAAEPAGAASGAAAPPPPPHHHHPLLQRILRSDLVAEASAGWLQC